jgi:uncharacterized lipoprotein YbaY
VANAWRSPIMEGSLISGKIVFDTMPENFSEAEIYVRLEDTSLADAPSRVVAEQVLTDVPARVTAEGAIPFTLYIQQSDPRANYSVSVHVSMHGKGKTIRHGDYTNTASHPVLTFGYPARVLVRVQRV